jgi:hypothetical protein
MFGNKVLRRIFGPNSEETTSGQRDLHNEPNIMRMFKSSRMVWAVHVDKYA